MAGRQMGGVPPQPHPVLLRPLQEYLPIEDRIARNRREIQVLRADHQEMSSTHVALKQELSLADEQLRQLATTARNVREERESEVKDFYEKSLAVEFQVRGIETLHAEHSQVVADVRKLTDSKIQLVAEYKAFDSELQRIQSEATEVADLKADVDSMRQQLHKGRAAIEFEKKTRAANLEQYQAMEKSMISMKEEIDRLRDELAHAEKRARAAAAAAATNPGPGYSGNYRSPDMGFQGGPYTAHYSLHQATGSGSAEGVSPASPSLYNPPTGSHDPLDVRPNHVPK